MTALFDGSTAMVITRPDATAGPIDRAFNPEKASAGMDWAARCGTYRMAAAHANAIRAFRSMPPFYSHAELFPEARDYSRRSPRAHAAAAQNRRLRVVLILLRGPAARQPRRLMRLIHGTLVLCALVLSACTAAAPPAPQAAGIVKPPVPLPISINALMVAQVDHAGHELWDAGKEGHAPKTAQDWEEIEHHAMQLAAAATLVSLGGTGQADLGWVVKPDWKPLAQKLSDTAMTAAEAAHAK